MRFWKADAELWELWCNTWLLRLYILVKRFCLSGQQRGPGTFTLQYWSVAKQTSITAKNISKLFYLLAWEWKKKKTNKEKQTGIDNEDTWGSWEFWPGKENTVASPQGWNKTCWVLLLPAVWGQLKQPRSCHRHGGHGCCTGHVGVMPIDVRRRCFVSNVFLQSSGLSLSKETCHYWFIIVSIS